MVAGQEGRVAGLENCEDISDLWIKAQVRFHNSSKTGRLKNDLNGILILEDFLQFIYLTER